MKILGSAVATALFFCLISSVPLMAEENNEPLPARYDFDDYRYEKALYSYLEGSYFPASELSAALLGTPLANKANILLRLSDSGISHKREYPDFTSKVSESPEIIRLLDADYRRKEYDKVLSVTRALDNSGAASYFEGMSLMKLDRLAEAGIALARVTEESAFYPYAVIALAQIDVIRRDFKEAEDRLRNLLSHPSAREGEPGERVRLLLGQTLFERGLFHEALNEFLQFPAGSLLYTDALAGTAWSLIKLNSCNNAIPFLKAAISSPSYDSTAYEPQILLGMCYLKINEAAQNEYFKTLMDSISGEEKRLETLIDDKALRGRYLTVLLDDKVQASNKEEQRYVSMLLNNANIAELLKENERLLLLRPDFLEMEVRIIEQENYYINLAENLEETAKRLERDIKTASRDMLTLMVKTKEKNNRMSGAVHDNMIFIGTVEKNILKHWRSVLKYDPTEETMQLVTLILQEWVAESMGCFNSAAICHVVSFLSMDIPGETPKQIQLIVNMLDLVARDLARVGRGEKTEYEVKMAQATEKIQKKIAKTKEAIKQLDLMREEIRKNIIRIDEASQWIHERLDKHVKDAFQKNRYELKGIKADIMKELSVAKKKATAGRTGNN